MFLKSNLVASDINRDMTVVDEFDKANPSGLISGVVVATPGIDTAATRYLPLMLEMNPILVQNLIDSYVTRYPEHTLVFTVSVPDRSNNSRPETHTWSTNVSRTSRIVHHDLDRPGELYISLEHGNVITREPYNGGGHIPPFVVCLDQWTFDHDTSYLLTLNVGWGYDVGYEPEPWEDQGPFPVMSKTYRLRRYEDGISIMTDIPDVSDDNYVRVDRLLADRENELPLLNLPFGAS